MLTKNMGKETTGRSFNFDLIQTIGKVSLKYYKQIQFNPSINDFNDWINSLKEPMKSDFKAKGLKKCKGVLNFQRYYLEKKDFGMDEFMKRNLSENEYNYWKNI